MSKQVQVQPKAKQKAEETASEPVDLANEELTEATEELLDDIDDVLEENAYQFVSSYIQAGGE